MVKFTRYSKRGRKAMLAIGRKRKWSFGRNNPKAYGRKLTKRVKKLEKMIETKEGAWRTAINVSLQHNQVHVISDSTGSPLNPLKSTLGVGDFSEQGAFQRVGDQVCIKGVAVRAFFENALGRPKVYFRVMVVKSSKGDTINRDTLFKQVAGNKMIDQVNTERFKIVASKTFNLSASNQAPNAVALDGSVSGGTPAGIATRTFSMWIPGKRFGRYGLVQYENTSSQPKFFDYRVVIVCYDWYGTLQDINNVGKINEMYVKTYFQDA